MKVESLQHADELQLLLECPQDDLDNSHLDSILLDTLRPALGMSLEVKAAALHEVLDKGANGGLASDFGMQIMDTFLKSIKEAIGARDGNGTDKA